MAFLRLRLPVLADGLLGHQRSADVGADVGRLRRRRRHHLPQGHQHRHLLRRLLQTLHHTVSYRATIDFRLT